MKFTERLQLAWWGLRGMPTKAAPYVLATWRAGQPQFDLIDYASYVKDGYARNSLVYACIRRIAESAAEPRWVVYRGNDPVPDHALQLLLDQPNEHFSAFELWELILTYLHLDGNAFLLKERSRAGRVVALWPMRPDLVHPVPDQDGDLLGYTYWVGHQRVAWLPEDIIHFKYPNPGDDLEGLGRGQSPLDAAARETDIDNSATSFLKSFFDNAAIPFGLLKSKQQLVDAEIRRIRARIKEQYAGVGNWNEIMILDADADYQQVGLNMDQMMFPDLRALSESRICMALGVPPVLVGAKVGLDRSTFANYAEARKSFWQDTLSPIYRRLRDKLNSARGLVGEFGDKRLRVECDFSEVAALQEARDTKFARADMGVRGGWITINESRMEVGLPPVEGGDVFLRSLAIVETPARVNPPKIHLQFKGRTERLAGFERLFRRTTRAYEKIFHEEAQRLSNQERDAILKRIERRKAVVDYHALKVDLEEVLRARQENWRAGFIPLFEALLGEQGDHVAAAFGLDFSLSNPQVQTFIRDYAFRFAQKVSATAADEIRLVINQAQHEGWDVLKTMSLIEGRYQQWTPLRAEMIARTETIRSSNAGAVAVYQQAGVTRKQWLVTEDDRTCPFCLAMADKIANVADPYWQVGQEMSVDMPDEAETAALNFAFEQKGRRAVLRFSYEDVHHAPLHPFCRCAILPVIA